MLGHTLIAFLVEVSVQIHVQHVSYAERLEWRDVNTVDTVVIHATETPDLDHAQTFAEVIHYQGTQTGNSGHFYIDKDGQIYEYVPLERVAHHVANHNHRTIGIELVNHGRYPDWYHTDSQEWTDPYPQVQIQSLIKLLTQLRSIAPNLEYITRHSDLDKRVIQSTNDEQQMVRRKLDPGATFPWDEFVKKSELKDASEKNIRNIV